MGINCEYGKELEKAAQYVCWPLLRPTFVLVSTPPLGTRLLLNTCNPVILFVSSSCSYN